MGKKRKRMDDQEIQFKSPKNVQVSETEEVKVKVIMIIVMVKASLMKMFQR